MRGWLLRACAGAAKMARKVHILDSPALLGLRSATRVADTPFPAALPFTGRVSDRQAPRPV